MDSGTILSEMPGRLSAAAEGAGCDHALLRDEVLADLFAATVDEHGDALAVEAPDQRIRWTYRELEARANQLAAWLRQHGVGRGDRVGLWLPRSADIYVGLLGILKCGAAYVPVDPEYPVERVETILQDARVKAVVTTGELAFRLTARDVGGIRVAVDVLAEELGGQSLARITRRQTGATPDDIAYTIYTSGSTGHPKGVPITHRSACHLVRAEGRMFGVRPGDRVFQGFSIAFDASVEEVWLAFFAGATLVPGSAEVVRSGAGLATVLQEQRITVLSCVPTLLALVQEDVPSVRLLILGGEACPPDLVRRWWRAADGLGGGRRVVNTYGPTEATVIATYADCQPGEPVTIGKALPNYRAYVVTEKMTQAELGEAGELCLSGVGLSPGYLNRPELTAEKFIRNPFCAEAPFERLYRTGDLARENAAGDIEFLGRIDGQVKLRGFRIELGEIEMALRACGNDVLNAAVTVREDEPGHQRLVGYVVTASDAWDERALKAALRARLPAYMVPASIERLLALPTLASGKVDRKSLPAPSARAAEEADDPPQTALERVIAETWARCSGQSGGISRSADFFRDLGGDSLLVAVFVSRLRTQEGFGDLAVRDVYQHPSIEKLAAALAERRETAGLAGGCRVHGAPNQPQTGAAAHAVHPMKHRLFCFVQTLCLYFVVAFYSLQWLTPYLVYVWMIEEGATRVMAIGWALAALLGVYPLMLVGTIVAKWALVGRMQAGSYPMWGFFHLRWWLMHRILDAVAVEYLEGTPLMSVYFRLMGARVGRNVHFRSYNIGAFDLVSIGDDTCLGDATALLAYTMEHGTLRLGPITIGRRCHVGAGSVLRPGTAMGDDARLMHMSLLPEGSRIARGETWFGSPARRVTGACEVIPPANRPPAWRRGWFGCLQTLGIFVLPVTYLAALFPGLVLLNELAVSYGEHWSILAAPVVALTFVVLLCAEIFCVKWLLVGRVKPGEYPVASWFFVRKWFTDQLMTLSLDILGPLYATLYLNPWYRALGAKMGRRAEISTACSASPDLLEIGAESFIADAVLLGVPEVEGGRLVLRRTKIGSRAFVGNSALLPAGTEIADKTLIGVLSTPPLEPPGATAPDTTWLGSPAIQLPLRQAAPQFAEESTFKPTRKLVCLRLAIEAVRILLPLTLFVALTSLLITTSVELDPYLELWQQMALFPVLYFAAGTAAALFTIAAKWLLVGRYRPSVWPLWHTFVWRSELVNALHETLAGAYLMDMLAGTPLLAWYFRGLGMKVGKRVYLDTPEFTEFDLVTIGDDAVLNIEATIQTHLFEDRVMKMSRVEIGPRCAVGACSVVLYDTQVGAGAVLEELSLVMKGESLPADTRWHGTPARRVGELGERRQRPEVEKPCREPVSDG